MGNEGQSWLPHQKIQSAWKGMRKEPVMKDRNKGKSEVTYERLEGDCMFKRHHTLHHFQEHAFAIIIFLGKLENITTHFTQRGAQVQKVTNKEVVQRLFTKQLSTEIIHGRLNTRGFC